VTESEWDDESRGLVQALLIVERNTGEFGEWLPEATSDDAAPSSYGSDYAYAATGPHTNYARRAALDAMDAHKKASGDGANLNGVYFDVERVTR
jgi:hypothetical protein